MLVYIILKIFVSYYVIIKKGWIKNKERLDMIFDSNIVIIFIMLIFNGTINIFNEIYILKLGIFFILFFFFYRIIDEIGKRQHKFMNFIETKKLKNFLLKPSVCKSIYYFVWMLPWNIVYWTYFWIMENGWYFRVWFCSNRDIFFKKYFGWDSRDFFFNFNKIILKLFKLIYLKEFYMKFYDMICRLFLLFYLMRTYLQKVSVKKYIFMRLVVYMYLSIFYLFFFLTLINYYLLLFFLFFEIVIVFFFAEILYWIEKKYNIKGEDYYKLKNKGIITQEFIDIKNLLRSPMYIDTRLKWEENVFIWDKTLSNSVTLNMLYKYMIWVNKNTRGYFDFKMNMRSRIHRKKFLEEKSIIWDVLPRTRYVIVNLKYFGYDTSKYVENGVEANKEYEFTNLIKNKNFFLSYYDKTYSKAPLTLLVWILRKHKFYWSGREEMFIRHLSEDISKFYKLEQLAHFNMFLMELMYIYINDKRYFKINMMLVSLFNRHKLYCCEELFFHYYKWYMIENAKNMEIPIKFCGIKDYKTIFKIMGRIQLNEEEVIVWNNGLQKMLEKKEELLLKEYIEIMQNDTISKEIKMLFRYNKFFFEEAFKDTGVLDEVLVQQFKIEYKKFSKILMLEPDLSLYYNKYSESSVFLGVHISNWDIFPDFNVVWTFWDSYPKEDVLFIFYCWTVLQYHYYLSEGIDCLDTDIVVKMYDI